MNAQPIIPGAVPCLKMRAGAAYGGLDPPAVTYPFVVGPSGHREKRLAGSLQTCAGGRVKVN